MSEPDYHQLLEFRTGLRRFLRWSEEQAALVGLTPAQHQLLLVVRGHTHPHGPTIGDIARYLLLRHHSTVGLVDRAETAGLVSRYDDVDDRRVVRVRLTDLGQQRVEQLAAAHVAELARFVPRLRQLWEDLEHPAPAPSAGTSGAEGEIEPATDARPPAEDLGSARTQVWT